MKDGAFYEGGWLEGGADRGQVGLGRQEVRVLRLVEGRRQAWAWHPTGGRTVAVHR